MRNCFYLIALLIGGCIITPREVAKIITNEEGVVYIIWGGTGSGKNYYKTLPLHLREKVKNYIKNYYKNIKTLDPIYTGVYFNKGINHGSIWEGRKVIVDDDRQISYLDATVNENNQIYVIFTSYSYLSYLSSFDGGGNWEGPIILEVFNEPFARVNSLPIRIITKDKDKVFLFYQKFDTTQKEFNLFLRSSKDTGNNL